MFNFKRLSVEIKKTDAYKKENADRRRNFLNIYTTYILRDFKPQISYNLLKVYLTTYNDNSVNHELLENDPVELAKVLKVYEKPLNRFISHNIVTRIMCILNTPKESTQLLTEPVWRDFKSLLKATGDTEINSIAELLRRNIFANVNLINYDYYEGDSRGTVPNIKEPKCISKDEINAFKNIIINKISLLDELSTGNISFQYQENLNAFYSLIYIYSILDASVNYTTITKVHDLIKYGNNNILHAFIPKECDNVFGVSNATNLQYIDLTTALCLCVDKNYDLKIDEDVVKDMKAYNLTRLQLSLSDQFNDCYAEPICEYRY